MGVVKYEGRTPKEWVQHLQDPVNWKDFASLQFVRQTARDEIEQRPPNSWVVTDPIGYLTAMSQNWPMLWAFRQAGYGDMAIFSSFFFDFIEDGYVPPCHREVYARYAAGYGENLLNVLYPREHGKTTAFVKMKAWHGACYFNYWGWRSSDPKRMTGHPFIVIGSESSGHAKRVLHHIKSEIKYNDLLNAAFSPPDSETLKSLKRNEDFMWNVDQVILTNMACILAVGRGSQTRGLLHLAFRPTLYLLDDLEGNKKVTNISIIKETRDWLSTEIMMSRQRSSKYIGRVCIYGTVVHENCLVNHLRKKSKMFRTVARTAIETNPDTGEQVALWPERKSLEFLLDERERFAGDGNLAQWLQENMNQAMSKGQKAFAIEKIKYFDAAYKWSDRDQHGFLDMHRVWMPENGDSSVMHWDGSVPVLTFVGVDVAAGEEASSDYNVVMVIAVDHVENVYVLEYWRKQTGSISEVRDQVFRLAQKYRARSVTVETVGTQRWMFNEIRKHQRKIGQWFKLIAEAHRSQQSKATRCAIEIEPRVDAGALHVRPNHTELLAEMHDFPEAEHDDLTDGLWLAVHNARRSPKKELRVDNNHQYTSRQDMITGPDPAVNPLTLG